MRITASKFGEICKATNKKDFKSLARSMTTYSNVRSAPLLHGSKYETSAINKYESMTGNKARKCGLFISQIHPMIAASPDGIVNDNILIEVKCPYAARDKPISHVTVPYLNENLHLKSDHIYYYQVQGQMFCADKDLCDFVVYTFADTKVVRIRRDQDFIDRMLEKLLKFYKEYFEDAVITRFLYKDYYSYSF